MATGGTAPDTPPDGEVPPIAGTLDLFGAPMLQRRARFVDGDRIELHRRWGPGPLACVIGHNPSDAGDDRDDPTSRWWIDWFTLFGFGGYVAVNLYPFVTPDPRGVYEVVELDELRARTTLSALIAKTVKLTGRGAEKKGCCPFHHEKTPSFTVSDDKGFYHCFGCGAHGDAIRWMVDGQGLAFMDAVKELAAARGWRCRRARPRPPARRAGRKRRRRAGQAAPLVCAAAGGREPKVRAALERAESGRRDREVRPRLRAAAQERHGGAGQRRRAGRGRRADRRGQRLFPRPVPQPDHDPDPRRARRIVGFAGRLHGRPSGSAPHTNPADPREEQVKPTLRPSI
jgi:hypothetical protein